MEELTKRHLLRRFAWLERHNWHSETFDVEGVDEQLVAEMFAESRRCYLALCKNFGYRCRALTPMEADIAADEQQVSAWGGADKNADLRWISAVSGTPLYPLM